LKLATIGECSTFGRTVVYLKTKWCLATFYK
jgi:hypothetical protein